MNQNQRNRPIDLLLIFNSFNDTLKKSINDKTICFCFNPSITLDFQHYQCHFEDPQNGEMQAHKSFIIDSEVHLINHKFSQVYGILASIGYEIKFTESENSFVELLLAASSLNRNSQKD